MSWKDYIAKNDVLVEAFDSKLAVAIVTDIKNMMKSNIADGTSEVGYNDTLGEIVLMRKGDTYKFNFNTPLNPETRSLVNKWALGKGYVPVEGADHPKQFAFSLKDKLTEMSQSEGELLSDAGFEPENGESGYPYIKELDNGDILKISQRGDEKWVISCAYAKSGAVEKKVFDVLTSAIANSDRFDESELEEASTSAEQELNASGRMGIPKDAKPEYVDFAENRLADTIDRLIGVGENREGLISLVDFFADNPEDVPEGYLNPEDFKNFGEVIKSKLHDRHFEEDDLEEQVNPSPAATSKVGAAPNTVNVDVTKLNTNQLNQLKTFVQQKDMINKKIEALKKQMSMVKESSDEDLNEEAVPEANAKKLMNLFSELNKMEKRHNRLLSQFTNQLEREKETLHLEIKSLMADQIKDTGVKLPIQEEEITESRDFSARRYFTDKSYASYCNQMLESASEELKIKISNKIIAIKNGHDVINENFNTPDKTELMETIEHFGQTNFKMRFIKEILTEMAIRQVKSAFILRWKDGTKAQQYPYPFSKGDKESIEAARAKAIEGAEKKIAAKKNDVRVEDGLTGETITGEALKLGRTTGTSKKEIVAKAKKERDKATFLLLSFRGPKEKGIDQDEKIDEVTALIPNILEELKKLDRDLLDFEEDFSDEHDVELTIDLYKSKADAVRNALINKRIGMLSILVDMETEDVIHMGTAVVDTAGDIDYEKDVFKNDNMSVEDDELVAKEPEEDEEPKVIVPKEKKAPTAAQLASRKKFSKQMQGLDKKTQNALNK